MIQLEKDRVRTRDDRSRGQRSRGIDGRRLEVPLPQRIRCRGRERVASSHFDIEMGYQSTLEQHNVAMSCAVPSEPQPRRGHPDLAEWSGRRQRLRTISGDCSMALLSWRPDPPERFALGKPLFVLFAEAASTPPPLTSVTANPRAADTIVRYSRGTDTSGRSTDGLLEPRSPTPRPPGRGAEPSGPIVSSGRSVVVDVE
jgi:hypothetical protein